MRRARRAAALPMVLMSLGLVGALAVGGAFAARRFVADARIDNLSLDARSASERTIVLALAALDSASLAQALPGSVAAASQEITESTVTSVWITVIGPMTVWAVAESEATRKPLSRRRLGAHARLAFGDTSRSFGLTWFELP